MSAKVATIKQYRADHDCDLRTAYEAVNAILNGDVPDDGILETYYQECDKRMQAFIETVFQASDLKYDACHKIVNALIETGHINV